MGDFIEYITNFFETCYTIIVDVFSALGSFFVAINQLNASVGTAVAVFPSFLGGIALSSFAVLVLLRIVGR